MRSRRKQKAMCSVSEQSPLTGARLPVVTSPNFMESHPQLGLSPWEDEVGVVVKSPPQLDCSGGAEECMEVGTGILSKNRRGVMQTADLEVEAIAAFRQRESEFNDKDTFYIFNHVDITIFYHVVEHEAAGSRLVAAKMEPKRCGLAIGKCGRIPGGTVYLDLRGPLVYV
ncbi:UNVERIFIED_CONTAM: hypothetical protein FKN15_023084 [Acipenser sinensis]